MTREPFDIRSLVRADLLEMPGYVPITPTDVLAERYGIAPEAVIKLDGNENPYGPSPRALEAIANEPRYHIYPDPDQTAVRAALADDLGVEMERIVCGLGSDDLIDLILRAVVMPGDGVINCPPTFGMYPFSTQIVGGRVLEVPRREDFSLDIEAIEKLASGSALQPDFGVGRSEQSVILSEAKDLRRRTAPSAAKLLFLASPNNPTGNRASTEELLRLLATGLLVVVDEAYIEFAGLQHSFVPMAREHANLVVLRTFSKWAGLAGLRAGYGIMAPELAAVLMTIKQPYNLNVAAGAAMIASLQDKPMLMERVCKITGTRNQMSELLAEIEWITPYPSEANFVLCRLDGVDAREAQARLAKRGIFVRYFDTPMLRNCLRISAGLPEHNEPVVRALREIGAELGR
jgi:histidinol-phosphate aminotransferase